MMVSDIFLQVIEYIQFLQEKVQKYEGSYQGWNHEPEKLMPWVSFVFSFTSNICINYLFYVCVLSKWTRGEEIFALEVNEASNFLSISVLHTHTCTMVIYLGS